ncbi:MAG: ParB/RepB/Spo0J family partition protein [Treponemataceae bacterium]|nr:ParB/RepB/Spo0J family partition protein [Treponemataceae bacterium]
MAKPSFGLGKGIGALMSEAEKEVGSEVAATAAANGAASGEMEIDVDKLLPNPHQPRTEFDKEALQELADSIKENGVIQPVLVEKADGDNYYIIAGERRTRAAKLAGLKKIPVRVQSFSEEKKLEIALIENIQREDLNALEEALAYRKLMDMCGITQDEVARRVGKNRTTVTNALRLLKLPENMQTSLANDEITAGHARALLSVTNPADQRILFARILGQDLSVRETERQAAELNGGGKAAVKVKPKKTEKKDPDISSLEEQFIEALGTKVQLKGSLDKGSLQIEYFSRDDLDRIFQLLVK